MPGFVNSLMPVVVRRGTVALTAGIAIITTFVSPPAHADVKLTSKVTTSGGPAPASTTGTIFYKGKKVRMETEKNLVLYDADTQTITNINLANKTYTTALLSALSKNPMLQMLDVQTTVVVRPGGKTKTILGKLTKNYTYTAVIKMGFKKEMLDRMKAQGGTNPMPVLPTITITGENWVAEQVNLPPGASAASMSNLAAIPGMKPLMEKFSKIKGVPLEAAVNIDVSGGAQGGRNQKITSVATALSETPLADSLFTVPAGFTKSEPPAGGMAAPPMGAPHN
jgi:hypothetical protein